MPERKYIRWMQIRLLVVAGLLVILGLGVIYRIWTLQVSQAEWLRKLARDQYLREISLEPMRGAIVDRHGTSLAVSVMTDSIFVMPSKLERPRQVAKKLAGALGLNAKRLTKKLETRKQFTWIKRRISPSQSKKVRELKIPGVNFTRESRRYYPARELASSMIGFAGDGRGLEGLELLFDGRLRGATVLAQGLRDARGNLLFAEGLGSEETADGVSLVLSMDLTIQEIAERELERGVRESEARAGTIVVMDPNTGEVLALANMPSFNPNTYWEYKPTHYRNRAVTDCFEPGSTMKIFTLAAALMQNVVSANQEIDCQSGRLTIGSHTINDSSGRRKVVPLREVFVHSSNVGTAKVGMLLGREGLYKALMGFGFNQRSGVELPGESRCQLRKPERWSDLGLATISFGQGISVSAVQLARALSAVANGGVLHKPRVVKEIRSSRGQTIKKFDSTSGVRVLTRRVTEIMTDMMMGVTEPGGTGTRAAIPGFKVAGKTGTAQKADLIAGGYSKDKRVASFVGFVPADKPRLAIVVVVDEPKSSPFGGVVAAPIFAKAAEAALAYLGVFPARQAVTTDPEGLAVQETSVTKSVEELLALIEDESSKPAIVPAERRLSQFPDLRGLSAREAVRRLRPWGLDVSFSGSGRVLTQQPRPGAAVNLGTRVELALSRRLDTKTGSSRKQKNAP